MDDGGESTALASASHSYDFFEYIHKQIFESRLRRV